MTDQTDDLFPGGTRRAGDEVVLAGRYKIVRELGSGAMGTVYLAEDMTLDGLRVALKLPAAIVARSKRAVAALKREAVLARSLSHPNIVTLRSFEATGDGVFLVMDYVEGRSLEEVLEDAGPMTPDGVAALFGPIAEALDYAHGCSVIHRDIKPANIMIQTDGTPRIADFGVAREMRDTHSRMTGETASGTLAYMSREQLRGEAPNAAQDVYSLAATMYECLTGHPPFHRGDITHQIEHVNPAPPLERETSLTRSIMRGLAKAPGVRPPSCTALVRSENSPPGRRGPSPGGRSSRSRLLGGVAVLLVLAVGGWLARDWWPSSISHTSAPLTGERSDRASLAHRGKSSAEDLTPPAAKPEAETRVSIDAPAQAALLASRTISVAGTVTGPAEGLFLNGEALRVTAGRFSAEVAAAEDGPVSVRITTSDGATLAERAIHVDTMPPRITLTKPTSREYVSKTPRVDVVGRVVDVNPDRLEIDGTRVPMDARGTFSWTVSLEPSQPKEIVIRAVDRAGHVGEETRVRLEYRPPPPLWEDPLSAAQAAGRAKDWVTAQGYLSRAIAAGVPASKVPGWLQDGIESWKRPPTLEVSRPRGGDVVRGTDVTVAGRMRSGRATDRVFVNDVMADQDPDGAFRASVTFSSTGSQEVRVEVRDGESIRATADAVPITLLDAWADALSRAVAEGKAKRWPDAAASLAVARSLGVPPSKIPTGLARGVREWSEPPRLNLDRPQDGASLTGLELEIAGSLDGLRISDALFVNGKPVAIAGGRFSVKLRFPSDGLKAIPLEVRDGAEVRLRRSVTVRLIAAALPPPKWAKVSRVQLAAARNAGIPVAFENKIGMRFVLVPAGKFTMGSPANERGRDEDEKAHAVTISKPYYVQITEVTNRQYRRYRPNHDSGEIADSRRRATWNRDEQPVVRIPTPTNAQSFAKWVTQQDPNRTYRLPTEAEWEYACRAGTDTAFSFGADIRQMGRYGNSQDRRYRKTFGNYIYRLRGEWDDLDDGHASTAPVASYLPNPWGLYDMHGNAWEWCDDRYVAYPDWPVTDPIGKTGSYLLRGGCYANPAILLRSSMRAGTVDTRQSVQFRPFGYEESMSFALNDKGVGFRLIVPVKR